jgi:cytochrome c-type biogenesis protein
LIFLKHDYCMKIKCSYYTSSNHAATLISYHVHTIEVFICMPDFPNLFIPAFIAGLLTFLAPCTFPLLPSYIALITGVSPSEISEQKIYSRSRRQIMGNALAFVLGFSVIFIMFGTLAGSFGSLLGPGYRTTLTHIGGIVIIFFGLWMIGVFKADLLQRTFKFTLPKTFEPGKPLSSAIIGAIFALGWTPCIGPILGGVLTLALNSGTSLAGAILLAVFSLGLAIPFLLTALLLERTLTLVKGLNKHIRMISIIGGICLVLIGLLMLTDNFGILIRLGYQLFAFLNYQNLENYL